MIVQPSSSSDSSSSPDSSKSYSPPELRRRLHRTRGDVLRSGQWIRSGLEQRGRDRRGRARDNDLHRVMPVSMGKWELLVHTVPANWHSGTARTGNDSIETKGHAASDHIHEHAKHNRIVAPRPTVVAERFDPANGYHPSL